VVFIVVLADVWGGGAIIGPFPTQRLLYLFLFHVHLYPSSIKQRLKDDRKHFFQMPNARLNMSSGW
jgi:hypothetical protein